MSETTVYKCVAFGVKITTDVCEHYIASLIGVIVPLIDPFLMNNRIGVRRVCQEF